MRTAAPTLTVVVPVFGSEDTLAALGERLARALDAAEISWQLVLVDDASRDRSAEVAAEMASRDPRIELLRLPENAGQQRALLAGFAFAAGEWIAALDADLQDPPEALPGLLAVAMSGPDVVFAGRRGRYESRARLLTAGAFRFLQTAFTGAPIDAGLCFVTHRKVIERLRPASERHPWLVGLLSRHGERVVSIPVERAPRRAGTSAYRSRDRLRSGLGALRYAVASRFDTEARRRLAEIVIVGLCATLLSFGLAVDRPFGLGDEGYEYLMARAWARGHSLFTDFRVIYPPGQHVWQGAWMRRLGESVHVLRWSDALLAGLAASLLWMPLRRRCGPLLAGSAILAIVATCSPSFRMPAMALVLAAALWVGGERMPVGTSSAGLGFLAGLLAGWREDCAVLMLVLAGFAALRRHAPREFVRGALPAALAGFSIWLAIAAGRNDAAAWLSHGWSRLGWLFMRLTRPTVVDFPRPRVAAGVVPLARALFPWLAWLPLAFYVGLLLHSAAGGWRGRTVDRVAVISALVGLAFSPQFVWERRDLDHLRAHLPIFFSAVAIAARGHRHLRRLVAAAFLVPILAALAARAHGWPRAFTRPYATAAAERIGARLIGTPPWAGLPAAPGETLIVLGWGPGWYAVEGLPPGTRFMSQFVRNLSAADRNQLAADVARPQNHWVIEGGAAVPQEAAIALHAGYSSVGSWAGWRLWRRDPP